MAFNVVEEAKRCLNCKNPMCRKGCPVNTPIPMIIQQFLSGQIDEAGKRLFENNPLSVVCSLVCDHEKQCEGNCVLGRKGTPVHFSHIENYISDNYLDKLNLEKGERKGQRVAIIGSGPAGITIAVILAQKGYDITIFEGREKIGGVLRYGIPSFRLPKSILDRYKTELEKLGIKIRQNTLIGSALTIDDLKREAQAMITGRIDPPEFYRRFNRICGKDKGAQVFTDMVAILPDPRRRAELLRLHELGQPNGEEEDKREHSRGGRGRRGRGGARETKEERPPPPPPPPAEPVKPEPEPQPQEAPPEPKPQPEQPQRSRKKRVRGTVVMSF